MLYNKCPIMNGFSVVFTICYCFIAFYVLFFCWHKYGIRQINIAIHYGQSHREEEI